MDRKPDGTGICGKVRFIPHLFSRFHFPLILLGLRLIHGFSLAFFVFFQSTPLCELHRHTRENFSVV